MRNPTAGTAINHAHHPIKKEKVERLNSVVLLNRAATAFRFPSLLKQ